MSFGPLQILKRETWARICRRLDELEQLFNTACSERDTVRSELQSLREEMSAFRIEVEILEKNAVPAAWRAPYKGQPTREIMFSLMEGWTTRYEVDGKRVGGSVEMLSDLRLLWHLDVVGGATNKRVLELGPLEGAHTKMMIDYGAREVVAIEGFAACWLRCLIVKEAFRLHQAQFLYGDFCNYVAGYHGPKFDFVLAAGVLYH